MIAKMYSKPYVFMTLPLTLVVILVLGMVIRVSVLSAQKKTADAANRQH